MEQSGCVSAISVSCRLFSSDGEISPEPENRIPVQRSLDGGISQAMTQHTDAVG
jgi:hypothetical protein